MFLGPGHYWAQVGIARYCWALDAGMAAGTTWHRAPEGTRGQRWIPVCTEHPYRAPETPTRHWASPESGQWTPMGYRHYQTTIGREHYKAVGTSLNQASLLGTRDQQEPLGTLLGTRHN